MGTSYHITVVEPDDGNSEAVPTLGKEALASRVELRLALINQQMSTYLDNSELSTFNRAPVGQWQNVSPELFDVLMLSLELGWLSNGAFDISVGPLVALWGFGSTDNRLDKQRSLPSQDEITRVLENVGFQYLEFNMLDNRVRKLRNIELDLSAIAKGYGVDKLAELLLSTGYQHFMVEVGGELRLHGNSPRGTPWRIAIEQPGSGFTDVHRAVSVSGVGLATSGDYRNYFEYEGKRYSHTINPKTGAPITHNLVSVTVIAQTSAYADGLATAISVMGLEMGLQLAQQQNFAVYFISKTKDGFETVASDAFKPYLE
ncbi:MAG: FAD:protein FMN transferase [Spongiibacteraceae bacterium]|nr:FAD:protein FMN transferase [Spongiibacteraceae bacterium]